MFALEKQAGICYIIAIEKNLLSVLVREVYIAAVPGIIVAVR